MSRTTLGTGRMEGTNKVAAPSGARNSAAYEPHIFLNNATSSLPRSRVRCEIAGVRQANALRKATIPQKSALAATLKTLTTPFAEV